MKRMHHGEQSKFRHCGRITRVSYYALVPAVETCSMRSANDNQAFLNGIVVSNMSSLLTQTELWIWKRCWFWKLIQGLIIQNTEFCIRKRLFRTEYGNECTFLPLICWFLLEKTVKSLSNKVCEKHFKSLCCNSPERFFTVSTASYRIFAYSIWILKRLIDLDYIEAV